MNFNVIFHHIIKYSIKNPVAFKVLIFLRHRIPKIVLATKSFLYNWKSYGLPEGIIKSTEKYAIDSGFRYHIVRNESTLVNKMPKSIRSTNDDIFVRRKTVSLDTQLVTEVPEGRVISQGYVLSHDNRVLDELAVYYDNSRSEYKSIDKNHSIFTTDLTGKPAEYINGKVAVLAIPFAQHNYFHWMMDLMPRFQRLQLCGYDLQNDIDYFYVNSTAINFQQETLRAAGIPANKVIDSIWHPHICAKELIVVSRPGKDCFYDYQTIKYLRDLFKENFKREKVKKIYLNRRNVRYRKITNEDKIEALLTSYGFESVSLDELSVKEQASLLSSSEIVVSGHGAALTNLIFCQEGTKVLEMFHSNNIHPMYWGISNLLNLDYHYIKSTTPDNKVISSNDDGNFSDMYFNLTEIERTLNLMLGEKSKSKLQTF